MDTGIQEKMGRITRELKSRGSVLVAFSGGVDSSVLAALAFSSLGDRAIAVTANSRTLAAGELECAREVAAQIGIRHVVADYDELGEEGFADNPPERCYLCKRGLFRELRKIAKKHGINTIADGTNASDLLGHRPGHAASVEEGVLTPLADAGVTKGEVRAMARLLGLPNAEKPSMACLASRFPYGDRISEERLARVSEAEHYIKSMGFTVVRVRDHGGIARIELAPEEMEAFLDKREAAAKKLRELGFRYITLDLEGFRSGSMDEVLK